MMTYGRKGLPMFDYSPTRQCNYNVSRNKVIDVLQGELSLLRCELECRDKIINDIMEQLPKDIEECQQIDDPSKLGLRRCKAQLVTVKIICAVNQKIHDDLRPAQTDIRRDGTNAWD